MWRTGFQFGSANQTKIARQKQNPVFLVSRNSLGHQNPVFDPCFLLLILP